MPYQAVYPVDPMMAFYAAIRAVEDGKIGEVELEYRHESSEDVSAMLTIAVRKEPRPNVIFGPLSQREEE